MPWNGGSRSPPVFGSDAAAAQANALGLGRRRGSVLATTTASTTFTTVGTLAPTLTSPVGATAKPTVGTRMYVCLSTAATTNSVASLATAFTDCRVQHRPRLRAHIFSDVDVANRRMWVGISDQTLSALALRTSAQGAAAAAHDFVGIGFDTAIGSDFKIASGDGTNYSCTDTGLAVVADTEYVFDVDYSVEGLCTYRITVGGVVHTFTKTTNLPVTTSVNVGPTISLTALENVQKDLNVSRYDFEVN